MQLEAITSKALLARGFREGWATDLVAQGKANATITNTRTGIRLSPTSGNAIAANTVDYSTAQWGGVSLRGVNVMATATNLVAEDVADWSVAGTGTATLSSPSVGITRIVFNGDGAVIVEDAITGATLDRTAACQARLISGAFTTVSTDYLAFREASSVARGTPYALEDLTTEWQDINALMSTSHATNQVAFRSDNATAATIEVRYMRATSTTSAMAPFEVGSSAAATYASDDVVITGVSYGTDSILFTAVTPYHWAADANPLNATPRFWTTGTSAHYQRVQGTGATISMRGSGGTPSANVSGAMVANQMGVAAARWDGVDIGCRFGNGTEVTAAETVTPTGDLDFSNGTAIPHANIVSILIDQSVANLTDAEQKQLALDLGHGVTHVWAT